MQIPADMQKWRTKFVWQMIGFAILLLLIAVAMVAEAWFFRAKFLANPIKLLLPTAGLAYGAVMVVWAAIMCIKVSIQTRKHAAKMKELEKNRPPLTWSQLREDLKPEKQEQFRSSTLNLLQRMPPEARAYTEANMKQFVERYRADLGSTPEVEADLARLEALIDDVLSQASMQAG